MGNKVFISYKYSDNSVQQLSQYEFFHVTTARDYVDIIQSKFDRDGIHIKGEKNNGNRTIKDFICQL